MEDGTNLMDQASYHDYSSSTPSVILLLMKSVGSNVTTVVTKPNLRVKGRCGRDDWNHFKCEVAGSEASCGVVLVLSPTDC